MKILAGLHDTPEGRAALDHAVDEAQHRDAQLVLVGFVANPRGETDTGRFERERTQLLAELDAKAAALRERGLQVSTQIPVGPSKPSHAILEVARNEDVDLIVIGTRRRSRVGKMILGSNAQDILLEADPPVVAVKAPEAAS